MPQRKIEIEDGVPIPMTKGGRAPNNPLRRVVEKMKVGQSIVLMGDDEYIYMIGLRSNSGKKTSTLYGYKWTMLRNKHNPGTYRVWRTK